MSPRVPEPRRRWIRWWVPGAVLLLAPKCILCVAGYLGLGFALGQTGAEICGGPDHETLPLSVWAMVVGVGAAGAVWFYRGRRRCAQAGGAAAKR